MPPADRDGFLAGYAPAVRDLVDRLSEIVRACAPTAVEAVKPGWRCLAFTDPNVGYFTGLFPDDDHVRVGFEFGVLLNDPDSLLTGQGSQLRYLHVPLGVDPPAAPLNALLQQALALPYEIAVRRAMVHDRNQR